MKWHHDKKGKRHIYPCRSVVEALNALHQRLDVQGAITQRGDMLMDDVGAIAKLMIRPSGYAVIIDEDTR